MKIPLALKKIIKKRRSEILRKYYLLLFKIRRRDIFQINECVNENNVYFTIELEKAGFTDQLIQFIVFYNLGISLNLKYVHSKLNSGRSYTKSEDEPFRHTETQSQDGFEDVYDYLGLNEYLFDVSHTIPGSQEIKSVILNLEDDTYYFNRGIARKELLVSYLKLQLSGKISPSDPNVLIRFRLTGHSSFFRLFNTYKAYREFPCNLREIYTKKREKVPQTLLFNKETSSLFVHIRQGDTAAIKTPWNTHVLVWGIKKNAFKEFPTFQEIGDESIISLKHYYSFIKDLNQHLGSEFFSARVYSDGFRRTFQSLYNNQERMDWSDQQIAQLMAHEKSYDQDSFDKFTELEGVKICIGEETTKLYELIHALLHARVVIIGTQQRMIPKLLSVYCDPSNMPAVIILTNKEFPSLQSFASKELRPFYTQVEINNYNSELIAEKVKTLIQLHL